LLALTLAGRPEEGKQPLPHRGSGTRSVSTTKHISQNSTRRVREDDLLFDKQLFSPLRSLILVLRRISLSPSPSFPSSSKAPPVLLLSEGLRENARPSAWSCGKRERCETNLCCGAVAAILFCLSTSSLACLLCLSNLVEKRRGSSHTFP
jgi:hypothetical protein